MCNKLFNKWSVSFLYVSIVIFPLNMLLSLLLQKIGFAFLAARSIYICYAVVYLLALVIFTRFGVSIKRLVVLYGIYFLYFILYLTADPFVKDIFSGVVMTMIYLYYLPYSILILSRIDDFSLLFSSKWIEYTNYFVICIAFIVKYVFNDVTNYMTYSYNLLPIWVLFTLNFIHRPTLIKAGIAVVMLLEGVIYGARGPLIWLAVGGILGLLLELIENKIIRRLTLKKFSRFIFSVGIFAGIFFLVRQRLGTIEIEGSYILSRLQQGDLGDSTGRVVMIDTALSYLKFMGGEINGLFFDRTIMPEKIYVHNFILETLLAFGWMLGGLVLVSLLFFVCKIFLMSNYINKKMVIFAVSSFFLKYFLSGSMYEGESFIIFVAILFAIYQQETSRKSNL
ncbi:hypothetical protein [Streptococcus iners]|uniref:O-antigen ligase domain-containing protein n=1 Tax=Streptococcus iners subsp. hyiners TaxID=3028083 RepID=A0AA96VIH0_9STRE|nr:hypothetical protein [Streptococcus sp. 29892]MCK4028958.1 hypothetical protein [Streptococcus suis]WNY50006.1 hypothetical protein PW220_05025 [Streptococcus sp. 29892]HEM4130168.1 hypothetical protein [Streptococcus suis]